MKDNAFKENTFKCFGQPDEIIHPISKKIIRVVLTGLLFAAAIVLSIAENSLQLPILAPGVKLGLANVVVMYALFFLGKKHAFVLTVLKALFAFITRGPVAGIISLSGGLASVIIMILLSIIFRDKVSYLILSIFGAITHNLGQLAAVSFIYTNLIALVHLPVLLVSGVLTGAVTAVLLRFFIPAVNKLGLK